VDIKFSLPQRSCFHKVRVTLTKAPHTASRCIKKNYKTTFTANSITSPRDMLVEKLTKITSTCNTEQNLRRSLLKDVAWELHRPCYSRLGR